MMSKIYKYIISVYHMQKSMKLCIRVQQLTYLCLKVSKILDYNINMWPHVVIKYYKHNKLSSSQRMCLSYVHLYFMKIHIVYSYNYNCVSLFGIRNDGWIDIVLVNCDCCYVARNCDSVFEYLNQLPQHPTSARPG